MPKSSPPDPALVAGLTAALSGPLPLLAKGGKTPAAGLFVGNTAGKKVATEAVRLGLVEEFTEPQTVTITTKTGKSRTTTKTATLARLTPAGQKFVLDAVSPKAALEALLPTVQKLGDAPSPPDPEAFRAAVADATAACITAIRDAFDELQQKVVAALPRATTTADPGPILSALQTALGKVEPVVIRTPAEHSLVSPSLPSPPSGLDAKAIGDEIVALVDQSARERTVGCDFSELYDALDRSHPTLTIGVFHDTLRALDDANRIRLSGWSRMLDDMPRPELALFVSHKVMYYAQPAR